MHVKKQGWNDTIRVWYNMRLNYKWGQTVTREFVHYLFKSTTICTWSPARQKNWPCHQVHQPTKLKCLPNEKELQTCSSQLPAEKKCSFSRRCLSTFVFYWSYLWVNIRTVVNTKQDDKMNTTRLKLVQKIQFITGMSFCHLSAIFHLFYEKCINIFKFWSLPIDAKSAVILIFLVFILQGINFHILSLILSLFSDMPHLSIFRT